MIFSVKCEELHKAIQLVIGAVERKRTFPILSNLCLVISDNKLTITATDLEIELKTVVNVDKVDEPFEITVSAEKLKEICKLLPSDSIILFKADESRVTCTSLKSRFILQTLPTSGFPTIEREIKLVSFNLNRNKLRDGIKKVSFSIAEKELRYYLNGMLFHIDSGLINLISSDSHRFSLTIIDNEKLPSGEHKVIIPRKSVLELEKLLNYEGYDEVSVSISTNHIYVETENFSFISKLIEGDYPDYRSFISRSGEKIVEIKRSNFMQAIMRVSILSKEESNWIVLRFENGVLKIFANNIDQEEADEEIEINYQDETVEIGINAGYIMDVCNVASNDVVEIIFSDNESVVTIREAGETNSVYLIMPMKL